MKTTDLRFDVAEKIEARHLDRLAVLYIRQSTNHQLRDHPESTARQYALTDRLRALGWPEDRVVVVDEDLGRSGSGGERREGFQRVLADITAERVGIVIGLEMSRLARNSKDWHDLFEVCAVFETLIADEDGVYDPNRLDDRLILGMKGIISEMELHTMKTRLERGRMNKAERGELFHDVPVGYVLNSAGLPEKDPDQQARSLVELVFDKFDELGSNYALHRYFVSKQIRLPFRDSSSGEVDWRVPGKGTLYGLLHHPLYAGAYSYGRQVKDKRSKKKYKRYLVPEQWKVLIPDMYPAYITWERFLQNLQRLRENDMRKDRRGPPREGSALLNGIIFCGHCNRRLSTRYSKAGRGNYCCQRHLSMSLDKPCQASMGSDIVDELVADRVLETLRPAALELSLKVVEDESLRRKQLGKQFQQQRERARYEARLAQRRYEAVDPDNRLIAARLEKQWELSLQTELSTEAEYENVTQQKPLQLSDEERQRIIALSKDVPAVWRSSTTCFKDRKEIVRCLVEKVIARTEENTEMVDVTIHWFGGYTSQHRIARRVGKYSQLQSYSKLKTRLIELRRQGRSAPKIAVVLGEEGFAMPKHGCQLTVDMVEYLLRQPQCRELLRHPELGPDQWLVEDLAKELQMPVRKLKQWVTRGWVHAIQRPHGGVWVVWADESDLRRLKDIETTRRANGQFSPELKKPRRPPT